MRFLFGFVFGVFSMWAIDNVFAALEAADDAMDIPWDDLDWAEIDEWLDEPDVL